MGQYTWGQYTRHIPFRLFRSPCRFFFFFALPASAFARRCAAHRRLAHHRSSSHRSSPHRSLPRHSPLHRSLSLLLAVPPHAMPPTGCFSHPRPTALHCAAVAAARRRLTHYAARHCVAHRHVSLPLHHSPLAAAPPTADSLAVAPLVASPLVAPPTSRSAALTAAALDPRVLPFREAVLRLPLLISFFL